MNGTGKAGEGRGARSRRRRDKETEDFNYQKPGKKKAEKPRYDKTRGIIDERPKWTPIKVPSAELPTPDCAYCGKPIKDVSASMTDKTSGNPVHFDCVIGKIAEREPLEKGESVAYIGGGRFGVVYFGSNQDLRTFRIKKILEWESTENRAEWRQVIADSYSIT
ncbi:hypothetical protein FACS1894151_04570 [Spirochaetia bacterium]|nr:hypothetical protein FACS1894151_04570 [Spirochaetia bacterium]